MSETGTTTPSASVVVVTYNRPDYLRNCLQHIQAQTVTPDAILVVDSSSDAKTRDLMRAEFPDVLYLRNPLGAGTTATARGMGLDAVRTQVIAFIDDDAYAHPDWLATLLEPYADQDVAGVGGRVRNGQPGEERQGLGQIGKFLPDGTLTGYFSADPGERVDVDHLLGASMSFRTDRLRAIGGIHDYYPGTCLREESDIALRLRQHGWRLVFEPAAVVDHVAGPYAKGQRFDLRYRYYSQRNHIVLLSQTVGLSSAQARNYLGVARQEATRQFTTGLSALGHSAGRDGARTAVGGTLRAVTTLTGLGAGYLVSRRLRSRT